MVEFTISSLRDNINLLFECDYSTIFNDMEIQSHEVEFIINEVELAEEEIETLMLEEYVKNIQLDDGIYEIEYDTNANHGQMENLNSEKTMLKIEDGKMKVVTAFNNGSLITINKVTVNGKEVQPEISNVIDGILYVETEINSLDDQIDINMTVNLFFMNQVHNYDIYVKNIRLPGVKVEEDANEGVLDNKYTIEVKYLKTGTTQTSAASDYFNNIGNLEKQEEKYTLTLLLKDITPLSNLSVTVDGIKENLDVVRNSDGSGSLAFQINSLNSTISIGCTIKIDSINYVNTTDFTVSLDKSTLKDSQGNIVPVTDEDILNIKKDATYTIVSKVIAGTDGNVPASALNLDTSSFVEVKHENIFLTLVFKTADFMDNRTITLNDNDSVTPYSKKIQDNKTYVSFIISSLSDKIKISGRKTKDADDGFTIVLDSSTLVESSNTGNNSNNNSSTTTDDDNNDDDLDDGTYTIKNKVLKEDSDSESHAREYVDKESVITVKNDKMYLTLKFVKASVIKDVSIKVDGKKTSYSTVKKTSDKLYIKFRIDSLSDEILVTTDLDLSDFGITNHDGLAFRVLLRSSTLEEDDDADNYDHEEDDDDEIVIDTIVNESEEVKEPQQGIIKDPAVDVNVSYKKTTYKVNNDIVTDSSFGYQAARGAVNQVSYYEIIDDKKYITLGFSQTDIMNNIRLSINGKQINYDIINEDKGNKTLEIRFEVPSISTIVTVTTNVTAMGRDISFGVQFLESTLELISVEESDNLLDLTGSSSSTSLSGTSNSSSGSLISRITNTFSSNKNGEGEVIVDEEATEDLASLAKEYFKKYTISNEVISDSTIGRSMARKYLNQTSIIEDIDGQLYATITFSSASSMGDFKIEVNGKVVPHTVPLNDMGNDLISLRFPISSVNDDIRVYMYINPMRMTINFGIKFLEDSMILIEEGTIGEEGDIESSSLVDTISDLNESSKNNKEQVSAVKIAASTSVMMIVLNKVLSGLGIVFKRFKTKSLLRKIASKE